MVNFYVNECTLHSEDDKTVKFIRNNCYASALGATQLQPEKFVGESSKFSFTAFIIGDQVLKMSNAQVKCTTKICLVDSDTCKAGMKTNDQDCDQDDNGKSLDSYGYKANTYTP